MNWDEIQGKWKQMSGSVREKWGKLTDDDIHVIGGKKDQLVGKLQERYGMSRDQAEKDLDTWQRGLKNTSETETVTETRTRTSGGGH